LKKVVGSDIERTAKELKVLDLWFEPVYEPEKRCYKYFYSLRKIAIAMKI